MRKLILSTLLAVSITFVFAQKNSFEKFADMDGVTSVYISKAMLSMIPKNAKADYGGVDVSRFLDKLSSILILTSEDKKIASQMLSMANDRVKGNDYELLMRVKSGDNDNVKFFMKGKPDSISELIMIVGANDGESVVMQFLGNFTMEDVQKMTEGINK